LLHRALIIGIDSN